MKPYFICYLLNSIKSLLIPLISRAVFATEIMNPMLLLLAVFLIFFLFLARCIFIVASFPLKVLFLVNSFLPMSRNKLPRNVFVVRYRPDKRKKSVVFGTYDKLKYALYTMATMIDWYDADSFDIYYIDSRGNSIQVFYWDNSFYGNE